MSKGVLTKDDRLSLLHKQYACSTGTKQRFIYYRKKLFWYLFVGSTKFLKRTLDIVLSIFMLIVLSPIYLLIAFIIKLYDRGPILYVTHRIGKAGKDFRGIKALRPSEL